MANVMRGIPEKNVGFQGYLDAAPRAVPTKISK